MSTYVLIHGSWHGGWCWEKVAPLLRQQGHTVETPDLPGHGADQTTMPGLTLEAYVERVCQVLDARKEPVILVGHSMGGVVVTQAAEYRPDKISALIYLSAFLPRNGESLIQLAQQDPDSLVGPNLVIVEDQGYHVVKDEVIRDAFYADCSEEDAKRAMARLVPEALAPVVTPVQISAENFGRVPRVYLSALNDRALSPANQRRMYQATPCRAIVEMATGHSPFYAAPEALAAHLLAIPREIVVTTPAGSSR